MAQAEPCGLDVHPVTHRDVRKPRAQRCGAGPGFLLGHLGLWLHPTSKWESPGLASNVGHTACTNSHNSHTQPQGPHPAQFTCRPYGRTSQTQALGSQVTAVTHAVASSVVPSQDLALQLLPDGQQRTGPIDGAGQQLPEVCPFLFPVGGGQVGTE